MSAANPCDVPKGSLLAEFGPESAYRDCFYRDQSHASGQPTTLEAFVTRFYSSAAFRPERFILGLVGHAGSDADAQALARGEADQFAVWRVVERRGPSPIGEPGETDAPTGAPTSAPTGGELLLQDKTGATASWLSVQPRETHTRLLFGSWVGRPDKPLVKALMPFHRWYSRRLLASA